MLSLKKVIPRNIRNCGRRALSFIPDKQYIQLYYFATTGRLPNLKNPTGFGEKQQWMKLYDRHPEYQKLVDKLAVKEYVNELLGYDACFPLLGTWSTFDEIDFLALPNQFVLKCSHDSGSTKVIQDKASLTDADFLAMKRFYKTRLKTDYYYAGREFPYRGIQRRIMAEELMTDNTHPGESIEDYKFLCFNGEPRMMFVATGRGSDLRFDFFDMDFRHIDVYNLHPNADTLPEKPLLFEQMKDCAAKLSKGMRFVRVDLYEINGKIYFGEYTFYHGGGFCLFKPEEWERRLGDWIALPELGK